MNAIKTLDNSIQNSSKVKIGKTIYDILSVSNEQGILSFNIQSPKSNQTKQVFQSHGDWFLITLNKRSSLPKFVTPEFI